MNKIIKVMIFLAVLWGVSYVVASLLFGGSPVHSGDQIAVIPVTGMITMNGGGTLLSSSTSGSAIVGKIEEANKNPAVKGIVLEINSPGGTVMGSKIVADAIKEVDKPVVAVVTEYGTSGAYWIASQADVIVADELSIVGSIGVLGSYLEFGGLLDDYNVTYQRLVTGDYKDISSPYREMTYVEENLMMDRLDGIHEYFVADVAAGRGMTYDEIDVLANGLFYLGQDAVPLGLVDEIGDKDDAINITKGLAGVSDGSVEEYGDEDGFFDAIQRYTSYSSYYIGQGIGSVLVSTESKAFSITV